MKPRKRIDQSVQDEAIKIFKGLRGKISNQAIAKRLHLSLRRVSQLKKEFQQTGTIKITYKNQHTNQFQRRKQAEREELRKIRQEFPLATLSEISQKMLLKGFFMSTSTISLRLDEKQDQRIEKSEEEDNEIIKAFRQFREKQSKIDCKVASLPIAQTSIDVGDFNLVVEEENPRIPVLPKEEIKLLKDIKQTNAVKVEQRHANTHIPLNAKTAPLAKDSFPHKQMPVSRFSSLSSCELLKKALRYRKIAQQASYLSRKAQEQLQRRIQYLPSPAQLEYYPKNLEDTQDIFLSDQLLYDQLHYLI